VTGFAIWQNVPFLAPGKEKTADCQQCHKKKAFHSRENTEIHPKGAVAVH
jgi:hypothetical protein